MAVVTAAVSASHWWRVEEGSWRHRLDRLVAKTSFAVFSASAWRVLNPTYIAWGWTLWVGAVACYLLSSTLHPSSAWVKAHAAFHACVAGGQALTCLGVAEL